MREIKFRAWDKKGKIMYSEKALDLVIHFNGDLNSIDEEGDIVGTYYTKDLQVMQYTGLKDKNGVEIYEGDIIEYDKIGEVDSHYIGVICFDKSTWRVNWNGKNCIRKDLEFWSTKREIQVIGNIYENLELLEGVE